MKSMTGFGAKGRQTEDIQLDISLRCVNGRFLEVRTHLPKEYLSLEADLRRQVQNKMYRSSVDVFVSRKTSPKSKGYKVILQKELAKEIFEAATQLKKQLKIADKLTLNHILRWPDVLQLNPIDEVSGEEREVLTQLLDEVLEQCDEERKREGISLYNLLKKYLVDLREFARKIRELAPMNQDEVRETLTQRWQKLSMQGTVDEQRLAQETVIFLDRSDISEELTRLGDHIVACLKLIDEKGPHGKKLEFFCQELLREVNTIGSKSQKSNLTQFVVEAKATIEKIREQVQNVE